MATILATGWKSELLQIYAADVAERLQAPEGSEAAADGSGSAPQPPTVAAQALRGLEAQISAEEMQLAGRKKIVKFLRYHIECVNSGNTPPAMAVCNNAWMSHVPQHVDRGDPSVSPHLLNFIAAAGDGCCRCLHDVLLEDHVGVNANVAGGPTALEMAKRSDKAEAQAFLIHMGGIEGITPTRRRLMSLVVPPPPPSAHPYSYHVPRNFNAVKAALPQYLLGFAAQDGCATCVKRMIDNNCDPMGRSNSGWVAMDWAGYGKVTNNIDTDDVMGIIEAAGGEFSGQDPRSCQPAYAE
jgi:hypothetical protein